VKPYITTVVTPAADRDLVMLADVREQLQFKSNDTAQDVWLAKVVTRASQQAERYCNRIFAEQTYQDTFGATWGNPGEPLMLGQAPIENAVVTVDGTDLDSTTYIADPDPGLLYNTVQPLVWTATDSIVVQYTAGFAEIPDDVQHAVISLCTMSYRARSRDPMLRMRETPGLGREMYWIGAAPGEAVLPQDIASLLNPFRRGMIG
jgi:hypothetical protein